MVRISINEAGGPAICAAVDCIAQSELGSALQAIPEAEDGYRIVVGSTPAKPILFSSYANHPNQLIVLKNGLQTTAAGRYQFLHKTWVALQAKLHLRDFTPINQDRACIELLRECGAYAHFAKCRLFNPDEFAQALKCAAPIWASLPGAGYSQHENKINDLATAFGAALARYATTAQALGVV
jgi:muramidase (phage lysozyme)